MKKNNTRLVQRSVLGVLFRTPSEVSCPKRRSKAVTERTAELIEKTRQADGCRGEALPSSPTKSSHFFFYFFFFPRPAAPSFPSRQGNSAFSRPSRLPRPRSPCPGKNRVREPGPDHRGRRGLRSAAPPAPLLPSPPPAPGPTLTRGGRSGSATRLRAKPVFLILLRGRREGLHAASGLTHPNRRRRPLSRRSPHAAPAPRRREAAGPDRAAQVLAPRRRLRAGASSASQGRRAREGGWPSGGSVTGLPGVRPGGRGEGRRGVGGAETASCCGERAPEFGRAPAGPGRRRAGSPARGRRRRWLERGGHE